MTLYALFLTYSDYECCYDILRGLFETHDDAELHLLERVEEYSKFSSEYTDNRNNWCRLHTLTGEDYTKEFLKLTEEEELIYQKYPNSSIGEEETVDNFIIRQIEIGKLI